MPKVYSADLREKVMTALESGVSAVSLSNLFKIARKTIYNWQLKLKMTGSAQPNKVGRKALSGKINDLDTFKKFVEAKPDRSSEEMAEEWGNISAATIRRYLKIIGFTNKKNIWLQKSLRNKTSSISEPTQRKKR